MKSLRERWRQWFFRRQKAESGRIELDRRRVYILPTSSGLLFVVVLVVMYIGAVNYNLGLGHALVFLLVGLGHNGMLYAYRNLVGTGLSSGRVQPVFAGETAIFELLFDNRRSESRPRIHLQLFTTDATSSPTDVPIVADLPPNAVSAIALPLVTRRRGKQPLGRLTVSTRYPLGLFRVWSHPWPETHCLVYPSPIFQTLPAATASDRMHGDQPVASDDPDDFAGFRRHRPGDSSRHIAWKHHARDTTDSPLLVKEFSGHGAAECWIDWATTPTNADTETRLSILCGWVLQAERANMKFGLRLPGRTLPPGNGDAHLTLALETLALFGDAS